MTLRSFVSRPLCSIVLSALLAACGFAEDVRGRPDAVPVLDTAGFWRVHYTLRVPVYLKDGKVEAMPTVHWAERRHKFVEYDTPAPASGWPRVDFDDGAWLRQAGLPVASVERDTDAASAYMALLCLRGKFQVTDPARANGLSLDVEYRGGIVVYLNGTEIARQHLPKDAGRDTFAESTRPDEKGNRVLTAVKLPANLLRRGTNVLAIEVHRAVLNPDEIDIHLVKWPQGVNIERASCGVERVRLGAPAGAVGAVVPNVSRPKGFQVWNSSPMSPDFDTDWGDPNEALGPVRIVGTRNGAFSGKVVVGSDRAIRGLKAVTSDLVRGGGGGRIPASAVEVRWARPGGGESGANARTLVSANRFEPLEETPRDEVPVGTKEKIAPRKGRYNPWQNLESPDVEVVAGAVVPLWITLNVPADAAPGDYRGTLTVAADGEKPVPVPVQITVSSWTLPDAKDYRTFVEVIQSPETLAMAYDVPLWSDAHFKLIDRSLRLIAQSGSQSVYVPLICETNLGNAESMVRWIRREDGTFGHDFTPMEKYLDLVAKHLGKPEVVCFCIWDTFLERTLGGRGDEKWNDGDVVKALDAARGHGPDVTLLEAKTPQAGQAGETEKLEMPTYTDPGSETLWRPVADGILRRMEKRGWRDVTMLGLMCDYQPSREAQVHLNRLFPDVLWVSHAHVMPRKDLPVGYAAVVYADYRSYRDPDVARNPGWKLARIEAQFPRLMRPWFATAQFRLVNEINIARGYRGSARFGGDFFEVLADSRGRLRGTIAGRFPKSHWHNLRIEVPFLARGADGPLSTSLYEMFREGVQECEARIFIETALTDKELRAKLGEEAAGRLQTLLDERSRMARLGVSTFVQSGHYSQHHTDFESWWMHPGIIGGQWYTASGWQQRSKQLFDAAAEVAAKIGDN